MGKKLIIAVGLLFTLTGCLTIEENYNFKKNGSGTMEYVVDMSELGEMLKSFEALSEDKDKPKDDLGMLDLKDNLQKLSSLPGISKVKLKKEEWVQRISFKFNDLNALNSALNVLLPDSSGESHRFFAWEGNSLVRTNNRHAQELGAGLGQQEEALEGEEGGDLNMGALLSMMKYKYHFVFASNVDSTVVAEGLSNTATKPREVNVDTDWGIIARDPKALDLRITLRK
ncbi:MAG: hypothetical protein JNL52_02910 [Flavobacteriales bacterium]|nr:hypothetical protein [Flavobacteriales bacterium]